MLLALGVLAVCVDCRKDRDGLQPVNTEPATGGRGGSGGRAGRGGSGTAGTGGTSGSAGTGGSAGTASDGAVKEAGGPPDGGDAALDGGGDGTGDGGGEAGETGDGPDPTEAGVEGGSGPGGCGVFYGRCCAGACVQPNLVCVAANPPPSPTDVCVSCGRRGDYCCTGGKCDQGLACQGFEVYGIYGRCQPCGAANQACCAGVCNGNLRCTGAGGSFGTCRP
jgi:hypothetical protein